MNIVIDTDDILHRARRWWWGHFGGFYRNLKARCCGCGKYLNAVEREHYAYRCEKCEGYWAWMEDEARG